MVHPVSYAPRQPDAYAEQIGAVLPERTEGT